MANNDTKPTLNGVLYKKHTREWSSAKGSGCFYYYILEVNTPIRWEDTRDGQMVEKSVTRRDLIKVQLPKGYDFDTCDVNDSLIVTYQIRGKEFKKKDGNVDFFNEIEATRIEFADKNVKRERERALDPFPVKNNNVPENETKDEDLDALPF